MRFGFCLIAAIGSLLALCPSALSLVVPPLFPPSISSVALGWSASVDTNVVGYDLSYGGASGVYTNQIDVGTNLSATISNLIPGQTYYFVVTSYNSAGVQSVPTPELAYTAPSLLTVSTPSATNSAVTIQFPVVPLGIFTLQASSDLQSWNNVWTFPSLTTSGWVQYQESFTNAVPSRFYRLLIQ
jgi:hypothetical protein